MNGSGAGRLRSLGFLVGLIAVTGLVTFALRGPDDPLEEVAVPGPAEPRNFVPANTRPNCEAFDKERSCVKWDVEDSVRDAVRVGADIIMLNTWGTVASLSPSTGEFRWAVHTGVVDAYLIPGAIPDRVLVRREDSVHLLDSRDGRILGRHTGEFVGLTDAFLILRSADSDAARDRILVIDVRTAEPVTDWLLPSGTRIRGLGTHLIAEDDARVQALQLLTGEAVWEHVRAPGERLVRAGAAGILLQAEQVVALDEATGERRWAVRFDGPLSSRRIPGADSLTAAVGHEGSYDLVAFDPESGAERWRVWIAGPEVASDTRVVGQAVVVRHGDGLPGDSTLQLHDLVDSTRSRSFGFAPKDAPRIVSVDPLVVVTADGLYGLDESALVD